MIVVDASTTILLVKAELLDLFIDSVKERVVMPKEVEQECYGRRESLDAQLIARAVTEKRIEVRILRQQNQYRKLLYDFRIGRGDAAAITLALSRAHSSRPMTGRRSTQSRSSRRLPYWCECARKGCSLLKRPRANWRC